MREVSLGCIFNNKMPKLFKNEESDSEEQLNINTNYATNYDNWRQKEELHKLKARYGDDATLLMKSDEESSESSEDDEGEQLPEEFEKNFYKTLACLKNKDPKIYNENVKFFNDPLPKSEENSTKQKKEKSVFLRDYERQIIVERGGKFSDSEDEENETKKQPKNPTYVQEQQELKESFKKVLENDEVNEEDLLKPKNKTKEEVKREDKGYKEWLKGQKKNIDEQEQKELKPLRDFWTDPNLDKNEKFLRDYILNKKFLEKDSTDVDLDYEHKAHDSDDNLSEDERNIDKQEEFEHKYNFRFEEPDQEFIKRYPRTLENSLRKKDTKRSQKRAEVRARKEGDKLKQREELKQLKALKRKEIEEKIEKLKEITGNDDLELNMIDLEEDFDPDEYDKKMSKIFDEQYYAEEKDENKPDFPDIDEELGIDTTWDNYDPSNEEIAKEEVPYYNGPHCEDPEFNMDADYDGSKNLQDELVDSTKKRKRRRRSKFAEMISKEKPKFDPERHASFQEYYNQYYALDYEDMIGDLPCRFKYRQVVPNDYGLTIEEILMADDRELNKWISLNKALQHKPEFKELNDVKVYKQKAANEALKRKILKSLYRNPEENEEPTLPIAGTSQNTEQGAKKKRKRKKKIQLDGHTEETNEVKNNEAKDEIVESLKNEEKVKKSKDKMKTKQLSESTQSSENNSTLVDSKKSNKKKRKHEELSQENRESESIEKKKKKKHHSIDSSNASLVQESNDTIDEQQSVNENNTKAKKEQAHKVLNGNVKKENGKKNKTKNSNDQNKNKNSNDQNKNKNCNDQNKNKNSNDQNKDKKTQSKKEQRKQLFLQKKKKANKAERKEVDQIASLSAERLKAYGLNPKKFKNKLKYGKQ